MNFCNANLGSIISTENTPEAEGYESENLLKCNEAGKTESLFDKCSNGFLAAHFVRPPVKLVVTFPCCIEISHIVICPKVGKQVSNAFLLETETIDKNWKKERGDSLSKHVVSKEFININPLPTKIIFRNPRFNLRKPFWKLPLLQEFYKRANTEDFTCDLKHPTFTALERVASLEITILRTEASSVPGLRVLEIWGQPCIRSPNDEVQKLIELYLKNDVCKKNEKTIVSSSVLEHSNADERVAPKRMKLLAEKHSEKKPEIVEIPDDFLDNLTYELMTQPIRLPSGLAVDSCTLEKYVTEEAIHGRLPNDPFTGVVFNDNLKPLADASLKSRIDLFLTQHSNSPEFKNLPRTLGGTFEPSSSLNNSTFLPNVLNNSSVAEKKGFCTFCEATKDSKTVFYNGVCTHIIVCRNCLALQERSRVNNCEICGIIWTVNDCKRIFIRRM